MSRKPDEIKADLASARDQHDAQIDSLTEQREEHIVKAKLYSKDIAEARRKKASAMRKLHAELGAVLAGDATGGESDG